jgi:hypothetical protein
MDTFIAFKKLFVNFFIEFDKKAKSEQQDILQIRHEEKGRCLQ